MEPSFAVEKAQFIENYNRARPIMTIRGDEVRQEILLALIEAGGTGGLRVGDIQRKSHVSRSAVSHHLKVLLDAGIICMRCIKVCPQQARSVNSLLIKAAAKKMQAACAYRKKNELFSKPDRRALLTHMASSSGDGAPVYTSARWCSGRVIST